MLNVYIYLLDFTVLELGGTLAISPVQVRDRTGKLLGGPVEETWPWSLRGEIRSKERGLPEVERVTKLRKG